MTVETNDTYVRLTISGTGPYEFNFRIFDEDELSVTVDTGALDPVQLVRDTDYTVTGVDAAAGGSIALINGVETTYAGDTLDIRSNTAEYQPTSIRNQGRFLPKTHEDAFDRLSRQVQDLRRVVDLKFGYPDNGEPLAGAMSARSTWTNRYLYVGPDGVIEPAEAISQTTLSNSVVRGVLSDSGYRYLISGGESAASLTDADLVFGFDPGDLRRYGGDETGTASSVSALINAGLQALENQGASLAIRAGVYRVSGDVTIPAGVTTVYIDGGSLSVDATRELTINGKIVAEPTQQIFSGAGSVLINKDANPEVWANWFAGSDIGAKINAAIASVGGVGPLTIRVAPGTYAFSTTIDLVDSESIRITGADTYVGTPNNRNPNLAWSPSGTANAIDASGSFGFEIDHLSITYTHAGYTGNLISLGIGSVAEARLGEIHHCSIQGTSASIDNAARLIELEGTLSTSIHHNYFRFAVRAIGCTATSNNAINIHDNWFEKEFGAAQIQGRGGSWNIQSNVFEGDLVTGPVHAFELVGEMNGLTLIGNMCVDGALGTGTLVNLSSFVCTSAVIEGNVFGGGATGVLLSATGSNSRCIAIRNNYFVTTTGINLSGGNDITVEGNRFQCTTPYTGTAYTRCRIGLNDVNGTSNSGISVANSSTIPISLNGNQGAGIITVFSVEDGAQAIFALSGGGHTVAEISDPNSLYTTASGGASSVNVYWSAGNNRYELQNLRGASRTINVNWLASI